MRRTVIPLCGGALAGLLLAVAFPPLDLPVGLLGVPILLALIRGRGTRAGAGTGVLAGVAFFTVHLWWAGRFGWYALSGLVLLQAASSPPSDFLPACCRTPGVLPDTRGPVTRALVLGGVWAGVEAARSAFPFGGFPWATLGSALHGLAPARRLAAWVGTSGLSALIVAMSVLALAVLLPVSRPPQKRKPRDGGKLFSVRSERVVATSAAGVLFALSALPSLTPRPRDSGDLVRIAIVQAGIEAPWASPPPPSLIAERRVRLIRGLVGERLDLVLWGENVIEGDDPSPTIIPELSAEIGIPLSSGVVRENASGQRWRNLVVAADPEGRVIGRYAKQRPVPFGEYVPLRSVAGGRPVLAREVPRDMLRGGGPGGLPLSVRQKRSCRLYESAFPGIVRTARLAGARLIEVHTNHSSYGRSAASDQHLALDQMRAAELGAPLARRPSPASPP